MGPPRLFEAYQPTIHMDPTRVNPTYDVIFEIIQSYANAHERSQLGLPQVSNFVNGLNGRLG